MKTTMRHLVIGLGFCICVGMLPVSGVAQVLYGSYTYNGATYFILIDVATCTSCGVFSVPIYTSTPEYGILPDGRIIMEAPFSNGILNVYSPPDPVPMTVQMNPPTMGYFDFVMLNGLMYISAVGGLYVFDPTTNQVTYQGPWPIGYGAGSKLYVVNGQIYSLQSFGSLFWIWQIDIVNPANSIKIYANYVPPGLGHGTTSLNDVLYMTSSFNTTHSLYTYDPATNIATPLCDFNAMGIPATVSGLTVVPPGGQPLDCIQVIPPCTTDAGTLSNGLPNNHCTNAVVTVSHLGNAVLESNDTLQYILFTNPNDTLGSIVAVQNSPVFTFNPATMQADVPYYIAAIAGNNQNGNVDVNDPCLDISNAVQVIWRPLPSVQMLASPNICQGGCTTIDLQFTGSPPFELTWSTPAGTTTATFSNVNGSLEICPPAGTPLGNYTVQAVALSDVYCACP
jgi:hypothetical protein